MDRPSNPENFERTEPSEESAEDETYAVREGVTRAIDPDEIELRRDRAVVEDDNNAARVHADIAGFDPDRELDRPPDFPESLDVATVAPDRTTVPGGTSQLTDPLGQTIGGGRSVSDSVKAGLGGLGGAPDRGLDFDLTSPGTQDQDSRETTGDPSVDRAISEHDGSQYSADPIDPATGMQTGPDPDLEPPENPTGRHEDPNYDGKDEHAPPMTGRSEDPTDPEQGDDIVGPGNAMENPEGDGTGESVTNLERVTVMQGSQVQPSNNPDDPATGVSTEGWIPPADLVTMPAQDEETADTTLTSAATLGTSPLTNPTDPVLGDDGIIAGGTYGGSGESGGGGEIMPTGMSAGDAPALGGEGEANLPITVEPAPVGGGASALGGEGEANLPITVEPAPVVGAGELAQKDDINGVSVDMATGQVIGSAALGDDAALAIGSADATLGGESLGAPGGLEGPPPMGEDGAPPDGDDS